MPPNSFKCGRLPMFRFPTRERAARFFAIMTCRGYQCALRGRCVEILATPR